MHQAMIIGNRTNLKGVEAESDILQGMKFGVFIRSSIVVKSTLNMPSGSTGSEAAWKEWRRRKNQNL